MDSDKVSLILRIATMPVVRVKSHKWPRFFGGPASRPGRTCWSTTRL